MRSKKIEVDRAMSPANLLCVWREWRSGVHAYCLFCETRRCGEIAENIERQYGLRCISPQVIQRKWVKGVPQEERHDWLPGYVFVYAQEDIRPWFRVSGIIRCLGNEKLSGNDLEFAQMLWDKNGIIGCIKLKEVGDKCKIADPAWENIEGTVVKLDRGRKRCCVAFEFDGVERTVWVGYDLV